MYEGVEKGGDVCSVMIVAVGEVTATINACDFSYPFLDDQLIIYCNGDHGHHASCSSFNSRKTGGAPRFRCSGLLASAELTAGLLESVATGCLCPAGTERSRLR
jgi:hypothetical protein